MWSRILASGDGIERMPVPEPWSARSVDFMARIERMPVPEPWSARPVDFMATAMSIEAAVARLDEPDDDLGSVPKYLLRR